jgi:hypothetical protein
MEWSKNAKVYIDARYDGTDNAKICTIAEQMSNIRGAKRVGAWSAQQAVKAYELLVNHGVQPFPGFHVEDTFPFRLVSDEEGTNGLGGANKSA